MHRSYLATHGRLGVGEVISIGVQLAETLDYVHGQGVIHRDLKPDNVLIGPDGHVTLTDFGIAQRMSAHRLTFPQLSNAVGTPDYMAPEQVGGQRGDARTDVYALGAMLYELLDGDVPYPASDTLDARRRKHLTGPPLISRSRPDAPPALEAILYRALRRRPEERYPSMAALRHDLTHLDTVSIPAVYAPDIPPPAPLGDLPPWRTALPILAIVLTVFAVIGILADLAHRAAAH